MQTRLIFVVLWLKGASSAAASAKCIGRHGSRAAAVIRVTSKESRDLPHVGYRLDHCYTYHRDVGLTSAVMPHTTAENTNTTGTSMGINEQPCLNLHLDDINLTSSLNEEVDCDVQSLTCDDLPDSLSHCSPMVVHVKAQGSVVTSCADVEDDEQFESLLPSNNAPSGGNLSTDTEKVVLAVIKASGTDAAPKPEESTTGRERVIHICDHCGKSFIRGKEYVEHRRTHTGEKPFHCEICGRGFSRFRSVAQHRRQHTGERPFVCDICAKQFFTSGELLKHRRYHSGVKPYHCSICGKQFLRCGEFTDHRRIHSGENVCKICGKAFTRLHNMREHLQSAHVGTKRYVCATCGKQFAYSSGLRYHRRLHKSERPFKCPECEKCFARMGELNRHRRGTHKLVDLPKLL